MQINPMFLGDFKYLGHIVIVLDEYCKSRKPDRIDDNGQAQWENKVSYTELGQVLHDYKYKGKKENDLILAEILIDYINRKEEYRYVTHVTSPPSGEKGNSIGNVVEIVANALNKSYIDLFRKTSHFSMFDIVIDEREQYLDSFICKEKLSEDMRILIIDDLIDSGATIAGCLKALERKGYDTRNTKLIALARTKNIPF